MCSWLRLVSKTSHLPSFLLHLHKGYQTCGRRSVILLLQSTNQTAVLSLGRDMVSTSKEREKSRQTSRPCWWQTGSCPQFSLFAWCGLYACCIYNYEGIVTRISLKFKSNNWPSYIQLQNQFQQWQEHWTSCINLECVYLKEITNKSVLYTAFRYILRHPFVCVCECVCVRAHTVSWCKWGPPYLP